MKRNNWHYKLHEWNNTNVHKKLSNGNKVGFCEYCRATVVVTITTALWLAGASLVFCMCSWAFGYLLASVAGFFLVLFGQSHLLSGFWLDTTALISLALLFPVLPVITIAALYNSAKGDIPVLPTWLPRKNKPVIVKQPKEPSLLSSYYKAWKSKVCPLIELED